MKKITHNFETKYPAILGRKFSEVEILATNVNFKLVTKQGVDINNIHDRIVSNSEADDPIKGMKASDLKWYILTLKDGNTHVMADEYMVPGSLQLSHTSDYEIKITNIKDNTDIGLIKKTLSGLGFKYEEIGS